MGGKGMIAAIDFKSFAGPLILFGGLRTGAVLWLLLTIWTKLFMIMGLQ
jgi:hypothetical protein